MSGEKKKVRDKFRNAVFARDDNKCRVCGLGNTILDAHHITPRTEFIFGGYVLENGISLCNHCHIHAENYYSKKAYLVPSNHEFVPENLYKLIGSSYEKAINADRKAGPKNYNK